MHFFRSTCHPDNFILFRPLLSPLMATVRNVSNYFHLKDHAKELERLHMYAKRQALFSRYSCLIHVELKSAFSRQSISSLLVFEELSRS